MRIAGKIEEDPDMEKILQCYIHMNGKASCKGCDLSEECKKFRKFMKKNSEHPIVPTTHTSRIMRGTL